MPYAIRKLTSHQPNVGHYQVINKDTGRIYAKHTTKEKAVKQVKLLHMKKK